MDEMETSVEHMGRRYLWRINKHGHRVHIENPETERAYCQVENCGGKPLDGRSAGVPAGRRLCGNCIDLAGRVEPNYAEPNIRVLLGERLAETEPELFASTAAPEPERADLTSSHRANKWEPRKQMRPAHRRKGRKFKRSNVKYARPFNDDLPW